MIIPYLPSFIMPALCLVWMDGWMDEWMNGLMDGCCDSYSSSSSSIV
ncbi:MAG: hypothetical protein QXM92_00530 [Candidatus Anstonellales archaeon]